MHTKKRDFRLEIFEMLAISNARQNYSPGTFQWISFYLDFRRMKRWISVSSFLQRAGEPRSWGWGLLGLWGLIWSYITASQKLKPILTPVETVLVPLCSRETRTESSFARRSCSGRHLSPEWRECLNSSSRTQQKPFSATLATRPIPTNKTI